MFQKNQATILTFTLLMSSGLIIGVFWWMAYLYNINLNFFDISNNNQEESSLKPKSSDRDEGFAQVSNVPSGIFRYGGSTTWAPIRNKTEQAIKAAFPTFDLRYINPNKGTPDTAVGIQMLLNNELDFSQTSRSLKDKEYEQAQQKGFTLTEIPVAIDGIAVAVHPELDVPGLTIDNLKKIYTGKITNWKDLGGPDLKVIPYSKQNQGGTVEFFIKNILQKEKFGNKIQVVSTTTEALRKLAQNRGGIYYASAPKIVRQCGVKALPIARRTDDKFIPPYKEPLISPSQCPKKRNQLNIAAFRSDEYPMTRRLFVVVKRKGQLEEQAGIAYAKLMLTQAGQKSISEAGFVRIR